MNVAIRSYVSSGIAVASVGAFVVAVPTTPDETSLPPRPPAVALAAQVQPLPSPAVVAPGVAQSALSAAIQIVGAPIEQARFHVAFVTDFLTTGAVLFAREFAIPGELAADVGDGVAVPVAVNRALQAFVRVELDAGSELVRFGTQYVDFQLRFAADVVQDVVVIATALPTAISELAASTVAGLMPAPKPASITSSNSEPTSMSLAHPDSSDDNSIRHSARIAASAESTVATHHPKAIHADATKHDDETVSDTTETNKSNNESATGRHATADGDEAAARGSATDSDHQRRQHESTPKTHGDSERNAKGAADSDRN